MDFFSKGYAALVGQAGQPTSALETVEKLCDRLQHATMLEDRRAAVMALKGLSHDWKKEVGEKGLDALLASIPRDRADVATTKAVLETITILCSPEHGGKDTDLAYTFTDQVIKTPASVANLLDILEEYDFYVRYNACKLLATLHENGGERLTESVLTSPMGISRLIDLLDDKREIVRNEGLLLLIALTDTNADIQKIVAFDNAFERLLTIIEDEEGISGGIIVQDCLQLVSNLLRYNVSNQNYFRETSCIQRLPGLLGFVGDSSADHIQFSNEDWSEQKVNNTVLVLHLIRMLVEPSNQNTLTNQRVMFQCNILLPIIQLGICSDAAVSVRTEALYAIADIIRSDTDNQETLAKSVVACPPVFAHANGHTYGDSGQGERQLIPSIPRPAIVSLIAIALNTDSDLSYAYSARAAAAYVCECYLMKNPDTQVALASTLKTPPGENPNDTFGGKSESAGSLLLDVLQDWEQSRQDPHKCWFACIIMSAIINDNEMAKTVTASIIFGDESKGEEPIPLLHQIVAQLMTASRDPSSNTRILIAYLSLLNIWLYGCSKAIKDFLAEGVHVQFLIEQVHKSSAVDPLVQGLSALLLGIIYQFNDELDTPFDRSSLHSIIFTRIGIDQFTSRLTRLREHNAVKSASRIPMLTSEETLKGPSCVYLDYCFIDFLKTVQDNVQRSISQDPKAFNRLPETAPGKLAQIAHLTQTLQERDAEIAELRSKLALLQTQLDEQLAANTTMSKEQEDLLMCMGEQEIELKKYRARLRKLSEQVTDDEEDEEEEEKQEAA